MKPDSSAIRMGLAVAAFGVAALAADVEAGLDESVGLRLLYAARGPIAPPADVVVVALDEPSARTLGLPEQPRGWPRGLHAELVDHLARSGAAVIGFDLSFEAPAPDPRDDRRFAEAIARAGNVVLTARVRSETVGSGAGASLVETLYEPLPALAAAARGTATFLLPKAQRVQHYWPVRDGAVAGASLPVLAHDVATGADAATLSRRYASDPVRLLNFYGPPRTIDTRSYVDVLQAARGQTAAGSLRGKAVFVGYSAATPAGQDRLRDDYRTVYGRTDGLDLSGVEIAATAYANLVDGRWLRTPSLLSQMAVVALWGVLLGASAARLRPRLSAMALASAAAAWWLAALAAFVQANAWWPTVVPIVVQVPLALLGGFALQVRALARDREAVRRAIGYYLPDAIVEGLARGGGPVQGVDRELYGSCLASDVQGYTTVSESMSPRELAALMKDYFHALIPAVEQRGGSVVDLVGDAMIAVWTAPRPDRAVRLQACIAACAAVEAVRRFNEAGHARPPLPTRFGLHWGEMLVGVIGGGGHYEYRAVGDIINTASRIQDLNKRLGTRLLASAVSVDDLPEITVRPLGPFSLAGKAHSIEIVEIVAPVPLPHDAPDGPGLLHARFARALDLMRRGDRGAAADEFAAVAAEWPEDGPSRYWAEQLREPLPRDSTTQAAPHPLI